ncbi:MAG: hypothetical protein D6739_00435, partial [Nitrospirae bacterium]
MQPGVDLRRGLLLVGLALELACLLAFQRLGGARPDLGVALLLAAFLPYGAALAVARRLRGSIARLALAATLLLHLALLGRGPTLDDDLWRYRWEGRVVLAGHNPYRHTPDDPALAPLRDAAWSRVAFRHVPTVYPPLAELLFAAGVALGGGSPLALRLLALAGHGLSLALLAALLAGAGLPRRRLLAYAWNPLVVKEVADSAHVDPWMAAGVLAALLWVQRRRAARAPWPLAAAIGVKWVPLLTLPLWRRALGRRGVALTLLLVGLLLLPFAGAGRGLFAGLATYADWWVFNPGVYWGLRGLLDPHLELAASKAVAKG